MHYTYSYNSGNFGVFLALIPLLFFFWNNFKLTGKLDDYSYRLLYPFTERLQVSPVIPSVQKGPAWERIKPMDIFLGSFSLGEFLFSPCFPDVSIFKKYIFY